MPQPLPLADQLIPARKWPEADAQLQAALPVLERHAGIAAIFSDFRRDFADALQTLGEVRSGQERWAEADAALVRSVADREKLIADNSEPGSTNRVIAVEAGAIQAAPSIGPPQHIRRAPRT